MESGISSTHMMRLSRALIIVSVSLLGQDAALEHARRVNLEHAEFRGGRYRTAIHPTFGLFEMEI